MDKSKIKSLRFIGHLPPGRVIDQHGNEVSILAADKGSGHALGCDVAIIDECWLLNESHRDLWPACRTSVSARPGGKLLGISIRGDCPMFNEAYERAKIDKSVVFTEYAADRDGDFGDERQWCKANPSLKRGGVKDIEWELYICCPEGGFTAEPAFISAVVASYWMPF